MKGYSVLWAMLMFTLAACAPAATPMPTVTSTLQPTTTEALTATITPTPTPEPRYEEIQGVRVPMNVYLDDNNCIPMELQGEEKCVNMFAAGKAPINLPRDLVWRGIVYVIGDVEGTNLTLEAGTEAYVAAHSDVQNLNTGWGEVFDRSGINYDYENLEGVHYGEPFRDEANHVSIILNGELKVLGTETNRVLLTSAAAEPTRWDWNEVSFRTAHIDYAIIEYHRNLGGSFGWEIRNSIVRFTECGICIFQTKGTTKIVNNVIYDAAHELIDIHDSDVEIVGNEIGPNTVFNYESGLGGSIGNGIILDIEVRGEVRIENNVFHDNEDYAIGFLGPPRTPPVIKNNIFRNNGSNGGGAITYYELSSELISLYKESNTFE